MEINKLIERIKMCMSPQKIIIFGSYAKGKTTLKSDLDIFIVKETVFPMDKRRDEITHLISNSLTPIDVHIYTPEEVEEYSKEPFSFVNSVLKTGEIVFDRDVQKV